MTKRVITAATKGTETSLGLKSNALTTLIYPGTRCALKQKCELGIEVH